MAKPRAEISLDTWKRRLVSNPSVGTGRVPASSLTKKSGDEDQKHAYGGRFGKFEEGTGEFLGVALVHVCSNFPQIFVGIAMGKMETKGLMFFAS